MSHRLTWARSLLESPLRGVLLRPRPVEEVPVRNSTRAPLLPRDHTLRVVVWNIQYAAGREHAFFYDQGRAVSVPRIDVERTLARMAVLLRALDPDVLMLQEVDRGARRTAYIDEHAWLARALDHPSDTSACYWRAPFVPVPRHEPLGRVNLHLSVISRFRLGSATRTALPALVESRLRRTLNLKRALLEVTLPLEGGGHLALLNTHLSAFSRGDGTLGRQMAIVEQRAADLERDRVPWILAGDFNSLAPGDDPERLPPHDRVHYAEDTSPIVPLLTRWHDPVGQGWRDDPAAWRTYLPFGEDTPDRTLDYLVHGAHVEGLSHRVVREATALSDHLPLLFEGRVR